MNHLTAAEIIEKLKNQRKNGKPILAVETGSGVVAHSCEDGGADLLIADNSNQYKSIGKGPLSSLLSYGNANQESFNAGESILSITQHIPVFLSVCGTDPFKVMQTYLKKIQKEGFKGVTNYPSVGIIDGVFRTNLENTGLSYNQEIEMIEEAHELEMITCPYVFNTEQAEKMINAGADILIAHMGLMTKGKIGNQKNMTLDDCVEKLQTICDIKKRLNPETMILCHGGPILEPDDVSYIMTSVEEVDGYLGTSSIERFSVEEGISSQTLAFKNVKTSNKLHIV